MYKLHKNITIIKVFHFSEFKCPLTNIVDYWTKLFWKKICDSPASIYLLKVSNRNTRTMYGICSELTMTPEQGYWHCCSAFFCQLRAHFTNGYSVSNVNFEQLNADWKSIFYFKVLTIFFYLQLGCPMANFGPLSWGLPHSPNVKHCFFVYFQPRGYQEHHSKVGFISPAAWRDLNQKTFWFIHIFIHDFTLHFLLNQM